MLLPTYFTVMNTLDQFNKTFREFAADLIQCFPADADFKLYKAAIQASMLVNEEMVSRVFYNHVTVQYGSEILARNDSFFLSNNYDSYKSDFADADAIVNKVKGYWAGMSNDNKDIVWKYFGVLVKLSQRLYASST